MLRLLISLLIGFAVVFGVMYLYPHDRVVSSHPTDLVINVTSEKAPTSQAEILELLALQDGLRPQRVFGSIPSLSTHLVERIFRRFGLNYLDALSFSRNRPYQLSRFFNERSLSQYGGITLFDYNIGHIRTFDEYKNFVSEIHKIFSQRVLLNITGGGFSKSYEVEIDPYIFADCDLVPVSERAYCRGPFRHSYSSPGEVIDRYRDIGITSTLSPDVDFQNQDGLGFERFLEAQIDVVKRMYSAGLIPVAKHYGYLRRFGDAHQEFVRVNLDPDEEYIFQIYERINDMDKPFFIMTSVHSLPKDEVNPVVFSEIYRSEIKSNYDNAVIMCDEIRMRPLSNFSIEAKVPRLTCDGFLVHSGNFLFRGPELVSGLEAVDDLKNYEYVLQLLLLKLQTGYLRIKEVAS